MADDSMEIDGPSYQQANTSTQGSSAKKRTYETFARDLTTTTTNPGPATARPHPRASPSRRSRRKQYQSAATRRIGGMFLSVYTMLGFFFGWAWARLTGNIPAEIVAVGTDASGKKRRAVAAGTTTTPVTSPVVQASSSMPGQFPEPESQETAPLTSPPAPRPPPPPENGRRDSAMEAPPARPSSPDESAMNPAPKPTTSGNAAAPLENARPRPVEDYDWKPKDGRRPVVQLISDLPRPPVRTISAVESSVPASYGTTRPRRPAPAPVRSMAQSRSGTDRDAKIDALVTKARRVVLESPEDKAFRTTFRERKKLRLRKEAAEAELLKKKEAEEAAARQKAERLEARRLENERLIELTKDIPLPDEDESYASLPPEEHEDATHDYKQVLIRPLDPDWDEKVDKAMETKNSKARITTTVDGTELSRKDFGTLLPQAGSGDSPSGWLNDEIVNAWMASIISRKNEQTGYKKAEGKTPAFAAYTSMWYTNYRSKGIQSIKNWSRRQGIQGEKLLKAEKIFLPVNTGAHWMLLIISPQARTIEFLDSLGGNQTKFFKIARAWLAMELGDKYIDSDWKDMEGTKSALQGNSDDCGVFVCMNGLASAKGRDFEEVGMHSLKEARRLMAAVLLNGGLKNDFEL